MPKFKPGDRVIYDGHAGTVLGRSERPKGVPVSNAGYCGNYWTIARDDGENGGSDYRPGWVCREERMVLIQTAPEKGISFFE